jgi:PAS domain S-box-containing protein
MSLALSPNRILIVDDEVLIARDIKNQLEALGYQAIGHATRGEEAIVLAGELRPDLVLMDIQLGGAMDGIAAAQVIRTQLALPVVFLTAFAADDILERAKLTEPFGYILKPFSPRELRTVIEMALYKHKAQTQLMLSEAFARSILDSVSSEIAVLNLQGVIIAVNEPWRRFALENSSANAAQSSIAGVGANYLAACQTRAGVARSDVGHKAAEGIQGVLDGRLASFSMEYPCHSPTQKHWFHMNVTPLGPDQQGAVVTHTNITDRKLAQDELQQSHDTLGAILGTTRDGFWIIDHYGRLLDVNPAYCQLSGYSRQELLGMHVWDLGMVESAAETKVHIGHIIEHVNDQFQSEHRRKDGSSWHVEVSASYREDLGGRIFVFLRDISQRRQIEEALKESEALCRAIPETAKDAIVTADSSGTIVKWNQGAQAVFGYSQAEAVGQALTMLIPHRFREAHLAGISRICAGATPRVMNRLMEQVGLHKDGTEFPLELSLAHLQIHEDHFFTAVMRDISSRKQAELALIASRDEAQASMQRKAVFLANMSHEIRTPMNGIMGLTELVLATELQAKQRENLELAYSAATGLLTVINDVLDFSKIEAGKLELEELPMDLRQTLDETLRPLALRASRKGLRLVLRLADEIPQQVSGDPSRLRQIISNLVDNAIKFTAAGEIVVNVSPEFADASELRLHFSVTDSGAGIPDHRLGAVFEAFAQVDSSTHREHGGTGLGLTICASLVQLMKGRIWAHSQLGQGSVFHVVLPFGRAITSCDTHEIAQSSASANPVRPGKNLRILLAEDNPVNQRFVGGVLTRAGHQVLVANNGQEAVDLAQSNVFDAILMDLMMPVLGGFNATRLIRGQGIATPIIAITAHALKGLREECLAAGMNDYIAKPVRGSALLAKLAELQGDDHNGAAPALQETLTADASPALLLDLESALHYTDGDLEMVQTMAGMVLSQIEGDLPNLRARTEAQQSQSLYDAAHRLKGSLTSVGANAARTACLALEIMAQEERITEFAAGLKRLEDELIRVTPELRLLSQQASLQKEANNGN